MAYFSKLRCNSLFVGQANGFATQKLTSNSFTAGSAGTAGTIIIEPATDAKGRLLLKAVNNDGSTDVTISNAAMAQASVISIPDPAASTADFVLCTAGKNDRTVVTSTNAELNILDGVTATAGELTRNLDVSTRIVTLVATGAVTEVLHEGKTCLLGEVGGNAEVVITLPEATGGGAKYRFVVSVVNSSSYKIAAKTTDTMSGNIIVNDSATAQAFFADGTDDVCDLNGTTTGGVTIGDWVQFEDILDTVWAVTGHITANGTEATPFSAT